MRDLEGITVVAVEQAVAAPYASGRLADAGARVIKVERDAGDFARGYDRLVHGESSYFVWLNRGKESVVLDLKDAGDQALLKRMIARADVFIQNLKPGALKKMGLDSATLRARDPRLITCDVTGFGADGPRSRLKAYDLIVQGEVGLCSITGDEVGGPARVGVSVCDIGAGMNAHAAILRALFARERTGRGRGIEVSLFDSVAEWMNVPLLQYLYGGVVPARAGVRHATVAPYGAYACKGGQQVIISVQNDREWRAFCEQFLERPDLLADPRFPDVSARVANRPELEAIVAEAFSRLTEAQASERLEQTGIAYGRLNELPEASTHPHLRFVQVQTPSGEVNVIAPAIVDLGQTLTPGPIPTLGQHSEALRAEFTA